MIKKLFFLAALMAPGLALGANPGANLSVQVTGGGGGGGGRGCPGGDSPYVPAGYSCLTASTDEFSGSSIDTSKWLVTGTAGDVTVSGGAAHMSKVWNGSGYTGGGLSSHFALPDAPSYIEWRRRFNQTMPVYNIIQMWSGNAGLGNNQMSGSYLQEETDFDMGSNCGEDTFLSGNQLCDYWTNWSNPSSPQFAQGDQSPPRPGPNVYDNSGYHIIGMLRSLSPAPNGSILIYADGQLVNTLYPDNPYYVSPSLAHTGHPDSFIWNMFCSSNCTFNANVDVNEDLDYVRSYCPGCN